MPAEDGKRSVPRLLIAAAGSGTGKTTLVCGLLAALRERGLAVSGFKIGPDYIDPGHQRQAGRCPVCNLDTWLTPPEVMKRTFARSSEGRDLVLVEGVMGLYDGGRGGVSSSAEIARLLVLPVVLVLNAQSMGESAAAVALGFREYDRRVDLRGVILNRLGSDSHRELIAGGLRKVGIPLLGALKRDPALTLPERHLGLVQAEEQELTLHTARLRAAAEQGIDIGRLIEIARSAPPLDVPPAPRKSSASRDGEPASGVTVAVARDEAFSFYYPDSLRVLEDGGAELRFFSPLADGAVPPGADALIFGGGYPENFARELEANEPMRRSVVLASERGMPILAECGGLMYLCRSVTDFEGRRFEMAGLVPARCRMNERLQTVGYVEARARQDTVLGPEGTVLRGHEFHFSSMTPEDEASFSWAFDVTRARTGEVRPGGFVRGSLLASYLHLHFAGCPEAAESFLRRARAFRQGRGAG